MYEPISTAANMYRRSDVSDHWISHVVGVAPASLKIPRSTSTQIGVVVDS